MRLGESSETFGVRLSLGAFLHAKRRRDSSRSRSASRRDARGVMGYRGRAGGTFLTESESRRGCPAKCFCQVKKESSAKLSCLGRLNTLFMIDLIRSGSRPAGAPPGKIPRESLLPPHRDGSSKRDQVMGCSKVVCQNCFWPKPPRRSEGLALCLFFRGSPRRLPRAALATSAPRLENVHRFRAKAAQPSSHRVAPCGRRAGHGWTSAPRN